MDKNKLTKMWDTVESGTGPKKFITLNVSAIAVALTVWVILYNVIPDAPVSQEIPQLKVPKSTKTKKENA